MYLRGRYFWCEWWNPQKQDKDRKPIQGPDLITLEADVEPPEVYTPDWWKKSKHRKVIQEFLLDVQLHRIKLARWEAPEPRKAKDLTLDELLRAYNDERERLGGSVEPTSMLNRANAMNWLKRQGVKSVRQLTQTKVLEIRRSAGVGASSLQAYVARLRPMFTYAVKLGVIKENPFQGVRIKVEKSAPGGLSLEQQVKNLSVLLEHDPRICAQVLYTRLGGYRAKDSTTLGTVKGERIDFEAEELYVWNNKGKRFELSPMSRAMKVMLQWVMQGWSGGRVFPIDDPKVLYDIVNRWTKKGIHIYKKCFADEVGPLTDSDDMKRYLLHHQAESMAMIHYQKPPVEQGRTILNQAQSEIEKWVRNGYTAPKRR